MNTIFVFGSNREGRHGKGAALEARQKWGAKYGQADGLQGSAYAIITKDLRPNASQPTLEDVERQVKNFLQFARSKRGFRFMVTRIGCGLAGFKDWQIAPLFKEAPDNCFFDKAWKEYLPNHNSWN